MAKLSLKQLQKVIELYVDENKIGTTDTFNATKNNIVGLIDKIGKIVTLDTTFYDKLPELDGDDLPYGKTIEEYFLDLILPVDYTLENVETQALRFYSITHRPVSYSYSLGRKKIPLSIPNDNIERAVNNEEQFNSITAQLVKRISDSRAVYKYGLKRELLGTFGKMCADLDDILNVEDTITDMTTSDKFVEGKTYASGVEGDTNVYMCVKEKTFETGDTLAELMNEGVLITLQLVKRIAQPSTTETGENFIKQVKTDIEKASDVSEGHSLNGNTIGAEMGLKLYVKQGVLPELEVNTYAGAFNRSDLAVPAEMKVIKDFGAKAPAGMFAMLVDYRGCRLHKDYEATRENFNGAGDFLNLFAHSEYTAFISRNVFVTIYIDTNE